MKTRTKFFFWPVVHITSNRRYLKQAPYPPSRFLIMKRIAPFFLFAVLLLANSAMAQLAGTYTIGGLAPDYFNISAAVNDLNSQGISAPVSFLIRTGTYDEQVTINDFTRSGSLTDIVSFEPAGAANVTWTYAGAGSSSNWVVQLFDASYINVKGIRFESHVSASPFGRIFLLDGATIGPTSTDISIQSSTFQGLTGIDDTDAIIIRDELGFGGTSDKQNDRIVIRNNTFEDGHGAIFISECGDCDIANNTANSQTDFGINIDGGSSDIENNDITDWLASKTSYKALVVEGGNFLINANSIEMTKGATGIRSRGASTLTNNMVYVKSSDVESGVEIDTPIGFGINIRLFHNTIYVNGSSNSTALLIEGDRDNGIQLQNNLIMNYGGGLAVDVPNAATFPFPDSGENDFNNYYTTGTDLFDVEGITHPNLLSFVHRYFIKSLEIYSVSKPVTFASLSPGADLHLSGTSLSDRSLAGIPIIDVVEDFDGDTRDSEFPFMGADERTPNPFGSLGGSYSVGPGQDFDSVSDAVRAANIFLRSSSVEFEIDPGIYDEQVIFPTLVGNSLLGTVTFKAAIPGTVTWRYSGPMAGIRMQGIVTFLKPWTKIAFEDIIFQPLSSNTYNQAFHLDASVGLTLRGCSFIGVTNGTNDTDSIISGRIQNALIENNSFSFGYQALDLTGLSSSASNRIRDNSFTSQTENAVLLTSLNDVQLDGNDFSSSTSFSSTSYSAIKVDGGEDLEITRNTLRLAKGPRGIEFGPSTPTSRGLIANNMIAMYGGTAADAGIWLDAGPLDVNHNTVFMASGGQSQGGFYVSTNATSIRMLNNIFYSKDQGPSMTVEQNSSILQSNWNNLFSNGPVSVDYNGTEYSNLDDYSMNEGRDPSSVSQVVFFQSDSVPYNLRLTGSSDGDTVLGGSNTAGILVDVDGDPRSPTTPYIGAHEASQLYMLGLDLTVFLSGPYSSISMSTDLNSSGILAASALENPYSAAPFDCGSDESITASLLTSNPGIVDWVCVELRRGDPSNWESVLKMPALLLSDGSVVSYLDASSDPSFDAQPGFYWVVVYHRNHLAVMSSTSVDASSGTGVYDYASLDGHGTNSQQSISGLFAMWGGDGDQNGSVSAFDFLNVWLPENGGSAGYTLGDFNMDGSTTAFDFLNAWLSSNGQASQVP